MIRLVLDGQTEEYEQDIRELCKSFYPGEDFEIHTPKGVHLSETTQEEKTALKRGTRGQSSSIRLSLELEGSKLSLTGDRKKDKSYLKAELYSILSAMTGRELPWGDLTGIRPISLVSPLMEAAGRKQKDGLPDAAALTDIRERMQREYLISGEKLSLMMEIGLREQKILRRIREKTGRDYHQGWSLYIGIPFCPTRCLYCSFTSNPIGKWEGRLAEYLDKLRQEVRFSMQAMCEGKGKYLQTIYIGGGTPTALPAYWLEKLMALVQEECFAHPMANVCEFTVEAGRPDSITAEKLQILKAAGVDRISVNPQTFQQKTLELIGRRHTVEAVKTAYAMARQEGFDNINMDIILGLPGERLPEVTETLCEITRLRPDSLTVHSLAVKRAARLTLEKDYWADVYRAGGDSRRFEEEMPLEALQEAGMAEDALPVQQLTEMERMMKASEYTARRLGLKPYYLYRQKNMAGNLENTGYCEEGKECLYNILMMEEKHTAIGCGAGTSSKVCYEDGRGGKRIERCDNGKDIGNYLDHLPLMLDRKRKILEMK